MKQLIMDVTLQHLFTDQEQLNKFMVEHNWKGKQTKDGFGYLVRIEPTEIEETKNQ